MPSISAFFARRNYAVATALIVLMVVWVASGLILKQLKSDSDSGGPESAVMTSVSARYSTAQTIDFQLQLRGHTEANRKVMVKAEISGLVASLPAAEGSRVESADVICELAAEDRQLLLEEAIAAKNKAQLDYDGAQRLKSGGYQSRTAIAAAKSALQAASAVYHRRQLNIANLSVKAPFAGIVDQRMVDVGDLMERGDPCAALLELDPLVISAQVAEADIGRLSVGLQARVNLITGQQVQGRLRFISHDSAMDTRTFRVEVEVDNSDWSIRSGISADISIAAGAEVAHRISPALLLLDDSGSIGVKTLDSQQRVHFQPVELVDGDAGGVWVRGLADKILLITVGQHYVTEGEQVAVTVEGASTAEVVSAAQ